MVSAWHLSPHCFWGWLTILLKGLLANTDPYTITWYRFSVAGGLLALFVVWKYRLPSARTFQRSLLFWLMAIGGLASNYILYLLGLNYISPSTAQVVMQTAPMFMLIGSFVFFKERFVARQWLGYLVLVTGMLLFFNQRLIELFCPNESACEWCGPRCCWCPIMGGVCAGAETVVKNVPPLNDSDGALSCEQFSDAPPCESTAHFCI